MKHYKYLSVLVTITAVLGFTLPPVANAQNLEVSRAQKKFAEETLPAKQKALNEKLGFELPIEFDYNSINAVDNATAVYSSLAGGALYYIVTTLEEIGSDDLGKQALQEKVSKVQFVHSADPEASGVKMTEKVIVVTMDGNTSTSEIAYTELKKYLEQNL